MDPSHEMHIQFVSNHTGSKPSEVFTASLPVPLSVALTAVVIPLIPQSILPQSRYASLRYTSRVLIHWLIENVTVICPILLSFTLLSNSTGMNLVMLLLTITSFMALAPSGWWSTSLPALGHLLHIPFPEKKPSFLTNYRAGLNLATAIAILAVDFQVGDITALLFKVHYHLMCCFLLPLSFRSFQEGLPRQKLMVSALWT